MLIDACFNFTHESFRKDGAEVLARAKAAGVCAMIVPGSSIADSAEAVEHAATHPGILFPTAGVHPHWAKEWRDDSPDALSSLISNGAVVAVGETGLDYYRNFSSRRQQLQTFEEQLSIAESTGLPLLLHQRDAHGDFIAALRQASVTDAVVHCFTGNRNELDAYLELGLYIGVTGWICDERRGTGLKGLIKAIPKEKLLIETDSPYLLPRDLPREHRPRNRRNEPAFLAHVGERVAECLGVSPAELARRTSANTLRLFRIEKSSLSAA